MFTSISHSLCLVPVLPVVWWRAHVLFTLIVCVCVCIVVSLQNEEILNRPVFVLDILKCLKILKITKNSEKILNITEYLNRF